MDLKVGDRVLFTRGDAPNGLVEGEILELPEALASDGRGYVKVSGPVVEGSYAQAKGNGRSEAWINVIAIKLVLAPKPSSSDGEKARPKGPRAG